MRRSAFILSSLAFLSVLQNVHAGPACARRNEGSVSCLTECASKWGWPGHVMGTNPWGQVMTATAADSPGPVVTEACHASSTPQSTPTTNSSAAQAVANDSTQSSVLSLPSPATAAPSPSLALSSSATVSGSSLASSAPSFTPSSSSSSSSPAVSPQSSSVAASQSVASSSAAKAPTTLALQVSSPSKLVKVPRPTASASSLSVTTVPSTIETPSVITVASTSSHELRPSPSIVEATTSSAPSPSASSTSSSSQQENDSTGGTSQSDISEYLSDHNTVRAQHGAAPLTWNNTLADKAQQWANGCVFQHSGGSLGPFGENLAAGTGSSYGIDAAIKSWTDEVSQYDPSNPQPSHFTQVVWKATTQVGCAVQQCNGIFDPSFGPAQFFVCEYAPQGNVIGEFAQNVQL